MPVALFFALRSAIIPSMKIAREKRKKNKKMSKQQTNVRLFMCCVHMMHLFKMLHNCFACHRAQMQWAQRATYKKKKSIWKWTTNNMKFALSIALAPAIFINSLQNLYAFRCGCRAEAVCLFIHKFYWTEKKSSNNSERKMTKEH